MSRVNLIVLFLIFNTFPTLALSSTEAKTSIKRFRTLHESISPYINYQGRGEILDATDIAHFEITRDQDNRIQSLNYKINGQLKPLEENYTWGNYLWSAQNRFTYRPGEIEIQHLDYLNRPPTNRPAFSVYSVTANGALQQLTFLDINREPAELNQVFRYQWRSLPDSSIGEIRYNRDMAPVNLSVWFPYTWVKLSLNENGLITQLTTTAENWHTLDEAVQIDFTLARGQTVAWVASIAGESGEKSTRTGPAVAEVRHEFTNLGYLAETRFFDEQGAATESAFGHAGFRREYSPQGNRRSYYFVNKAGQQYTPARRGYSGQGFKWDVSGRLRTQHHYFDASDKYIVRPSLGYAVARFLYDHQGASRGIVYETTDGLITCSENAQSAFYDKNHQGMPITISLCPDTKP